MGQLEIYKSSKMLLDLISGGVIFPKEHATRHPACVLDYFPSLAASMITMICEDCTPFQKPLSILISVESQN